MTGFNEKSKDYDIVSNFFESFQSVNFLKNKKKWNKSGLSKALEKEIKVKSLTDDDFNKKKWKTEFSENEHFLISFLGNYFFNSFFNSRKSLDFIVDNLIKNNGIKIESQSHIVFSNVTLGENVFLFSKNQFGINFILSFSSPWKYGFVAMQIIFLDSKKIINLTFNNTDKRISDQVIIDLGKVLNRYLMGSLNYLKNNNNKKKKKILITNYNYPHIGHNIWNGLSAWGAINNDTLSTEPVFLAQSICYEFKLGKIPFTKEKKFDDFDLNEQIPFFIKSDYIPSTVSKSIIEPAESLLETTLEKYKIPKKVIKENVLLINLRSGNRTIENNIDFHKRLLLKLIKHSNIYIILDGMNSSEVEEGSSHKNIETNEEIYIANNLTEINPNRIFSIVGSTIKENLSIAKLAKITLAPWGAGLAKYSWICHSDLIVYSSNNVLSHKPDLNIYSDHSFFDYKNNVKLIDPSFIVDKEDRDSHPSRWNFRFTSEGENYIYEYIKSKVTSKKIIVKNSYALLFFNYISNLKFKEKNVKLELLPWDRKKHTSLNRVLTKEIHEYIKSSKSEMFETLGSDFFMLDQKFKIEKSILISNSTLYLTKYGNLKFATMFSSGFNRLVGFIFFTDDGFKLFLDESDYNNKTLTKRIINEFSTETELDLPISDIESYLKSEKKTKQALVLNHWHIGHHVWNELSALQKVFESKKWYDNWFLVKSNPNSEHFGLTRDLFGNKGSNEVTLNKDDNINKYIIENNLCAFIPINRYINKNLSCKIMKHAYKHAGTLKSLIKNNSEKTNILFNLRLGDRELLNQKEFIITLSHELKKLNIKHTIYIDGINNIRGFNGESVLNNHALEDEVLFANEIVSSLPESCISIIGCSVYESLVICDIADFYIAPWGAGLSKYAWLTDTKGYVHTSNYLLKNKKDLNIYDNDKFSAEPKKINYLPGIKDENSPHIDPFRKNYSININLAIEKIIEGTINV